MFEAKTFETPISMHSIAERSRRCGERPQTQIHLNHQPPRIWSQGNQWTKRTRILTKIGKSSIVVMVSSSIRVG